MSADNMIYVQNRRGIWRVWMGFASDPGEPKPNHNSAGFVTKEEAIAYAMGWQDGMDFPVEYGIIQLPPKP